MKTLYHQLKRLEQDSLKPNELCLQAVAEEATQNGALRERLDEEIGLEYILNRALILKLRDRQDVILENDLHRLMGYLPGSEHLLKKMPLAIGAMGTAIVGFEALIHALAPSAATLYNLRTTWYSFVVPTVGHIALGKNQVSLFRSRSLYLDTKLEALGFPVTRTGYDKGLL